MIGKCANKYKEEKEIDFNMGFEVVESVEEECILEANEMIVGLNMGINENTNLTNLKFVIA